MRRIRRNEDLPRTNIIAWCRWSSSAYLQFYSDLSKPPIVLKEFALFDGFPRRNNGWVYFQLTDEEVIDMVLPRII